MTGASRRGVIRTAIASAIALMMAGAIAGCTSQSDSGGEDPDAVYVAPAWMAEQAQADDELIAGQKSCLTSRGVAFDVDGTGMFTFADAESSDMLRACTEEVMGDEYGAAPTPEGLKVMYERAKQTRACLINEGFEVGEPITEEKYVDTGGQWSAYQDVQSVSTEEMARLRHTCPESGIPAS